MYSYFYFYSNMKAAPAVVDIKGYFLDPIRRTIFIPSYIAVSFDKFSCVQNKIYLSTRLLSHLCLRFIHNKVWSSSWQSHFVKYSAYNPYVTIQHVACQFYLLLYYKSIQASVWNKVPVTSSLLLNEGQFRKINPLQTSQAKPSQVPQNRFQPAAPLAVPVQSNQTDNRITGA